MCFSKIKHLTKIRCSNGDPTGNRTPVTAVKGRCLDRLTIGPKKPATSYFPRQSPAKYPQRWGA